ncbi:TAXI family TRAP transporter solute-binding subunit [Lutibaculum baratangense]|uniref:TRAP transporter solute receptor, TAXI family n=1 Tax=Lutibaculum baratangense AMV1 TaxID=631454 RepID=V4RKL9_9HYPH|nr:TAXI family TRAP transporter solute-binding subunit [Lutibaculum baratangense]ESR23805.1 TRAP transporter solute receptor, TAXI family precursor [Lutibaculum baratangense AMV1]
MNKMIARTALAAGVLACTAAPGWTQTRMSIATGSSGGVYYLWGGALAKMWSEGIPDTLFNIEATTGQVPNVKLFEAGNLEVSMVNIATAYESWEGIGDYNDRKYQHQRALFAMYPSYYVMVSLADSDIDNIEDWEGKRVAVGTAGGTVDVIGRNIASTLGVEPAQYVNSGWPDVPGQIRDGLVDTIAAIGGQPWPPIRDLETTHDLKFYALTDEQLGTLKEAYPYFIQEPLPEGAYEDQPADYNSLAFWNMTIVRDDVSEEVAYQMIKIAAENVEALKVTHPSTAEFFDVKNVLRVSPVPLHPGAVRYFEEIGAEIPERLLPPEG